MNRADDCAVERAFVSHPTLTFLTGAVSENAIQILSQAFAHFVCGAIGKGDGDDLIDIKTLVFAQDVKIALDEDGGFARARAGGYRNMPVKRVCSGCLFGF